MQNENSAERPNTCPENRLFHTETTPPRGQTLLHS